MKHTILFWAIGLIACGAIFAAGSPAHAASISIVGVSPTGVIAASTTVTFSIANYGFIDPSYSISDSYSSPGATGGSIDQAGYFTWTPTIYDGGTHTLTVTAQDSSGATASASITIIVAANTLIVQSVAPGSIIAAGRSVSFSVLAPGFINPTFSLYDAYSGSSITPSDITSAGAFTWTPTASELGQHTIAIQANDPEGHSARTSTTLTVIGPSVSVPSYPSFVAAGSLATFVAHTSFTNPTWTLVDIPTSTSTSLISSDISPAGVFSWIPAASDIGDHTISVIATDAYGNTASTTIPLTVTLGPVSTSVIQSIATSSTPTTATASSASNAQKTSAAITTGHVNTFTFATYMGIGSHGAPVLALQKELAALALYSGPQTGYYGPLTSAAVRAFQSAHGIAPLGFVGPATRAKLNSL